jgi:nucleoside-diphosphate kinase
VIERTLAIIKPDGVKKNLIGEVIRRYENKGFRVIAMKLVRMTKEVAKGFYFVHRERPFYESLTDFMSSGNCVVMVLEGEDVIIKNRELMGATNPKEAAPETIRKDFGSGIEHNVVHGSDSKSSADFEIPYFFNAFEIPV